MSNAKQKGAWTILLAGIASLGLLSGCENNRPAETLDLPGEVGEANDQDPGAAGGE